MRWRRMACLPHRPHQRRALLPLPPGEDRGDGDVGRRSKAFAQWHHPSRPGHAGNRDIGFPSMTELKFFRLMLVVLATLVLSVGSGWAYLTHKQRATEAAIDSAFGEYNRYIAACGDNKASAA